LKLLAKVPFLGSAGKALNSLTAMSRGDPSATHGTSRQPVLGMLRVVTRDIGTVRTVVRHLIGRNIQRSSICKERKQKARRKNSKRKQLHGHDFSNALKGVYHMLGGVER